MDRYTVQSGLNSPEAPQKRYLWTDAFALCTYLELYRLTRDGSFLDTAYTLIGAVHYTLGRHRDDDERTGWISGLEAEEGKKHPTIGGLRIGKKLNERGPDEPYDPNMEWDRDGQYFHYLTKWIHALLVMGKSVSNPLYVRWAAELGRTVHNHFLFAESARTMAIYWKMSIDLSRPLVHSTGQHDPIDGLVTFYEIDSEIRNSGRDYDLTDFDLELSDMKKCCRFGNWSTDDPLGTGGLLFDAYRLTLLIGTGYAHDIELLEKILDAAMKSLLLFLKQNRDLPSEYRLAFRELGLALSLHGVPDLISLVKNNKNFSQKKKFILAPLQEIRKHAYLIRDIEETWIDPKNRTAPSWLEHEEINSVMLAASLIPGSLLTI